MPIKDRARKLEVNREWYARNRGRALEQAKQYRKKAPEKHRTCTKRWAEAHPQALKDANLRYRKKLKLDVLSHYGGRCACCGEDTPDFLALDHAIQSSATRKARAKKLGVPPGSLGAGSGFKLYVWVRQMGYPPEFRVMCHNCHYSSHYFGNGVCWHKRHATSPPGETPSA